MKVRNSAEVRHVAPRTTELYDRKYESIGQLKIERYRFKDFTLKSI